MHRAHRNPELRGTYKRRRGVAWRQQGEPRALGEPVVGSTRCGMGRLKPWLALAVAFGGFAGVRVGEASHPGPVADVAFLAAAAALMGPAGAGGGDSDRAAAGSVGAIITRPTS